MAKRMQFSVVGLPHYTIWHLYEPSFEDIRHMEEMEQERKRREEEERLKKERLEKIGEQFDTEAKLQYEKDKEAMRNAGHKAKEGQAGVPAAAGPAGAVAVAGAGVVVGKDGGLVRAKDAVREDAKAAPAPAPAAAQPEDDGIDRRKLGEVPRPQDDVTKEDVRAGIAESEM